MFSGSPPPYDELTSGKDSTTPNPVSMHAMQVPKWEFGEYPAQVTCPNCHQSVISSVNKANGAWTYAGVCILCIFW